MKLDRNITNPRRGKYALIKLREATLTPLNSTAGPDGKLVVNEYSVEAKHVDFGDTEDSDFFVIRLKDKYAVKALLAYAAAAALDDPEYANEIRELVLLAVNHPNRKKPD